MEKLRVESKPAEDGNAVILEPLVQALSAAAEIPRLPMLDWALQAARAVVSGWPTGSAAVALHTLDASGAPVLLAFGSARGPASPFPVETAQTFQYLPAVNIWGDERPTYAAGAPGSAEHESVACVSSYQVAGKVSVTVALRLSEKDTPRLVRESTDLMAASLAGHARSWIGGSAQVEWFSTAESVVALLALEGLQEAEIARRLFRSAHTVHDHLKEIYRKSGAMSRAHLVALAHSPRTRGVGVMPPETLPESSAEQARQSRISRQPRVPSPGYREKSQVPISVPSI